MTFANIVLVVAGLTSALTAGVFFGFATAVNPGLGRLTDNGYLAAMQSINVAILNPVFLITFMGPVLLLPLAAFLHADRSQALWSLVAASALYVVGVFGITVSRNVPLNERLVALDLAAASAAEQAQARGWYQQPWNRWHLIRTVASVLVVVLLLLTSISD